MLSERRSSSRLKWLFCFGALALLAAPMLPSFIAGADEKESAKSATLDSPSDQSPVALAAPPPLPAAAPESPPEATPAAAFEVNGVLALDTAIDAGDYAWNEEGVPDGPTTVVVDLRAQRIYVYRGGIEIGRSSIIYGADDKPTPTGIFPILQKKRHHVSNLYGAPMPYMMRLTNDGVAIHASDVDYEYATHGCVGVPDEFAALLFAEADIGDKVMVTNEWLPHIYYTSGSWPSDDTI